MLGKTLKFATLFAVGGLLYGVIEIVWRGYTHISMFLVGGICFVLIGALDEIEKPISVMAQLPIAALLVTAVEFTSGVIINLVLNLGVWDYSDLPLNVWGQVCLPFSLIWLLLAFPAIIIEDSLRVILFNEPAKVLKFLPIKLKRAQ